MIITGIIIVAAALILMVAGALIAGSGAYSMKSRTAGVGGFLYVLAIIGYIVGLAVTAIGIVQALT